MSTDIGHRKGCSFGRTARCNCTYLAQWDKAPEYTAPTFRAEPPVTEGCTRHYPEGGGYLDIPNHLNEAFLKGGAE